MPDEEHYYLGIDLGTTNSCIHWGALNPGTKQIEPRELTFDQLVADGNFQRRSLLPSFIYFKQGDPDPTIGEYARVMGVMAQPSRVARSVKNHMGQADWGFTVDGRTYSAAELSAMLLETLLAGIRATWGDTVPGSILDVVITVPASFDSDMRADTLEAARLAGFKTQEDDGSPRNLLLDEPRASLYDLINQQAAGQLPPGIMDFTTPKTILVFDLGGGTLDVSLHRVCQPDGRPEVEVEDLAISRYTQLGGDVFDSLIADELQARFEQRHKIQLMDLSLEEQWDLRLQLELEAEQAKRRLTSDVEARVRRGAVVAEDFAVDIQIPYLWDNKGLFTQLTKGEMNRLIGPLLAEELTLDDVDRLDDLEPGRAENIITPILDVLRKARVKEGRLPPVDAVLLSGGMTRLHAIRERLHRLFGFRPLTVLDPDRSVSRGAAVYHSMLHRGHRPRQILAETIGLEVHGNRVHPLVPAGTVLPVRIPFTNLFEVPYDNASVIRVPLYRGEAPQPLPPNKKISERRFILSTPQRGGAPLDVEVAIDENKVVTFIAKLHNRPDEQIVVEVGAEDLAAPVSPAPIGPSTPAGPHLPTGPAVDVKLLRNEIRAAAEAFDVGALRRLELALTGASNTEAVVDMLLAELTKLNRLGRERLLYILGEIGRLYPEHPRLAAITTGCLRYLVASQLTYSATVNTVTRNAVVALGKIGSPVAEGDLINLLGRPEIDSIRSEILFSLGKCSNSTNAIKHILPWASAERDGDRIAALWALGRLGSRERWDPLPMADLEEVVLAVYPKVAVRYEPHTAARKYAAYVLGEICDQRPTLEHDDLAPPDLVELADKALQRVESGTKSPAARSAVTRSVMTEEERQLQRFAALALRMIRGESLSTEEQGALMAVRALLAVGK